MKITIVASEAVPFAKTGGLADVVTALARELVHLGNEVTIMMPKYRDISMKPTGLISPLRLNFAGRQITYSIIESVHQRIKMVFIDAPGYFDRPGLYGDASGDYKDNDERFVFFARACLKYYERRERPEIFHCNDWQTALIPLFLRTHFFHDELGKTPVLFTVHNMAYQGIFPPERFSLLEIGWEFFTSETLEFYGKLNFLKSGILFSDLLTTVSQRYAEEIQTSEFSYGLEGTVASRRDRLHGVLNGIDETVWNPQTDPLIPQNYSAEDLSGKAVCRKALLSFAGWPEEAPWPILGIISRMTDQKGFDLLESAIDRLLSMHLYFIVLGTGDAKYEQMFEQWKNRHPQQMAVALRFDNELAHKIEAGADMFLMPSRYEPCGLNQMYSLKYGTVPIVRATGGLDDTVQEWNRETKTGNGFKFHEYSADSLVDAVARARNAFGNREVWQEIVRNGMSGDYSWKTAAHHYLELYTKTIELK